MKQTASFRFVRMAQALFILNTLIWIAFGIASLNRMRPLMENFVPFLVIGILMFGNAAALLLAGLGLGTRRRLAFYFAIFILLVNIILTLTDQFGALDLATLVIDAILLGILFASRSIYLHPAA